MKLKDFLSTDAKEILCLSISDTELKAAVLVKDDSVYVVKVASKRLDEKFFSLKYLEYCDDFAFFIADFLEANNMQQIKNIGVLLSDETVLRQVITLPAMDDKEVNEALNWEKEQYIPFTENTYSMRSVTLRKQERDTLDVLIYAAENKYLEFWKNCCKVLGKNLIAVTESSFGNGILKKFNDDKFIYAEKFSDAVRFTAYENNKPCAFYDADVNSIFEDEIEKFSEEIFMTKNISVNNILIGKGISLSDRQSDTFLYEYSNFNDTVSWDGEFLAGEEVFEIAKNYHTVIGAGTGILQKSSINFLGKDKSQIIYSKKLLYYASAVVIGILCFSWALLFFLSLQEENRLEKLQNKLAQMDLWQQRYEESREVQAKINNLEKQIALIDSKAYKWSLLLKELGLIIPQNCWIESIQEKNSEQLFQVEIKGKAAASADVEKFLHNIKASKIFSGGKIVELRKIENDNNAGIMYFLLAEVRNKKNEN